MEFMDSIGELQALPPELHILCPRQRHDDFNRYDDQDSSSIVQEAERRKEKFLLCMRILAFHQEGLSELQDWIWRKLDAALSICDVCIRKYYTGKIWLMEKLKEQYDDEEIEKFFRMLDDWDIKRITHNLKAAENELKAVPREKIGLNVLQTSSLLAIFECMSCEAMLRNDALLREHFDTPFNLIQTNRTLKLTDYIPALSYFLFDPNQNRNAWAVHVLSRIRRAPTADEFDWALKEGLFRALAVVTSQQVPEPDSVQRLWRGMQLIVAQLDKEQITHHLRALEIDPCRLSVEHLSIPLPSLRYLLTTIQIILEKAPGDFWDAMQAISPQAIAEQVFYNPQLDKFLLQANAEEPYSKSALKDMLSWIMPFMYSLKGANKTSACRFLVAQLFKRALDSKFPNVSRHRCLQTALSVLLHTLRSFTDNESSRGSVTRIVLSETLEVVSEHISVILNPPKLDLEPSEQEPIMLTCMDVIRNTLALECQSLKTDYEVILREKTLQHGVSTYSQSIWDAVVQNLRADNLPLSSAALRGILDLVGLERFPSKSEDTREKENFNLIYSKLTQLSCQIFEKLADFSPAHLNKLFVSQDTCSALVSGLFSADPNTYQAAVDLIKAVSGQSARRDAISHLLQSFFSTTMHGLTWSYRRISHMKTFASAPRMIHTGTDIVDILCDTQSGMLRTRKLADRQEAQAVYRLWEYLWVALRTIFDETETWHHRGGAEKSVMLEFCRDTIQFADLLFDQYGVFSGALADAGFGQISSAKEGLLKPPLDVMQAMAKWLRLKDEYLATTLVGLVSKVLRRLADLNVTTVPEMALAAIEDVAVTGKTRTILTPREKAELVRALEAYYKRPVVTASTASLKKQTTITSFVQPVDSSGRSTPTGGATSEDSAVEETVMQLSRSVELNKARLAAQAQAQAQAQKKAQAAAKSALVIPKVPSRPSPSVESFREKREREKEAKRKRDQAELARLKKNAFASGVAQQTAGQGSGVLGVGVRGKDHTPAESMMVSSGSESEESEDEVDAELFGKKTKTPDAVREYEESKRQSLKQRGPVKKIRQWRSAKDMRARLAPDLSPLHHTLLSWDFFASGDLPPTSDRTDYTLVSSTFSDPIEYQRTFEPLLILEAWQGFQSAKEEGNFKPFEIQVATRLSVDSFVEVSTTMNTADAKDLGIGEADLVLLSMSNNPASDKNAKHCLARVQGINKKKGMVEVSYRVNPGNNIVSHLSPGVNIWGVRISSLTPLEREYGALKALQYYDLCDEIIKARPSPMLKYSDASLEPIIRNYNVNPAQAKAIKSALDNDAFTLIQGPPGSGKTKTIVALVGALLSNSLGNNNNQGVAISRPGANTSNTKADASKTTAPKKLLVCAPSNAAVDELVMRFKEPVKTLNGRTEKLSVIRLGRTDAINTNVLDVTLDELVNARLGPSARTDGEDLQKIYEEHKSTDTAFKEVRAKLDRYRSQGQPVPPELEREFDVLKKKRTDLSQKIDDARDRNHTAARNAEMTRRRVQQEIINGAHVICATLSGSGHEIFQTLSIEFETVIIDEAAQSIELSALIPLKYGCAKCILVGDPKQLPPTVLSKEASRFQYEQSLFVRMQTNHPDDVHLLDVQYRMHPEISRFPSATFYDGRLQDGPNMEKLRVRPWHNSELLGPYRFFDVQGLSQNAAKGHSLVNIAEVNVAMQLYERLVTDFGKTFDFAGKIGIITPYKGQLKELKARFTAAYGNSILTKVEFNTTDAFQGRESEVIIFSCVRASDKGIGFLSDIRRMNVGLTRAKSSLWVLGNSRSLMQGEFWNKLIVNARERGLYTDGDVLQLLKRPQFTGYHDVEMVDADGTAEEPSRKGSPPTPQLSSEMESISARDTPASTLDGPSGGYNGLNDNLACGICGSFQHHTRNCDNEDALEAVKGNCRRCGKPGHSKVHCTAPRCKLCGEFGHVDGECRSTTQLSRKEQLRIANEELRHKRMQQQRREQLKQRSLEAQDPKVPVVRVSEKSPPPEGPPAKRKLSSSGSSDIKIAKTKLEHRPPGGLVKPSKDGPAYAPIQADKDTSRVSSNGPATSTEKRDNLPQRPPNMKPPGHQGPKPPPPIRRKKEVDPFIRPKRR